MFLWLGVALVIDAIDGPLARALNVAEVLPRWSGETLDLVVDYTTYVFVPAYAVAASGLMPDALAIPAAAVIAITGALYFADREMKTERQFLPRLSGGVEPGRVLSSAAAAGARHRGRRDRAVRRADLRADPFRPSVPGAAAAHGDRRAADAVGGAGARCGEAGACAGALDHDRRCARSAVISSASACCRRQIGASRWLLRMCCSSPARAVASAPRPRSWRRRAAMTSASPTRATRNRRPRWSPR